MYDISLDSSPSHALSIDGLDMPAIEGAPSEKDFHAARALITRYKRAQIEQIKNTVLDCPHCISKQKVKDTLLIYRVTADESQNDNSHYLCLYCQKEPVLPEVLQGAEGELAPFFSDYRLVNQGQ
jgi:DNA-directed RNA polymerase subunit RPC12/RpoP